VLQREKCVRQSGVLERKMEERRNGLRDLNIQSDRGEYAPKTKEVERAYQIVMSKETRSGRK